MQVLCPYRHMPLIGFNSRLFPGNWRPFVTEIEFARANGFEAVHLSDRKGGLDAAHLGDSFERVAQARAQADRVLTLEIMSFVKNDGRDAAGLSPLDVLEANLPAIKALPVRYVHWHVAPSERLLEENARAIEQACVAQFQQGTELAARHGFVLGFEQNTTGANLFHTPEIVRSMLDRVPGIGLVWDTNHTAPEHLAGYLALAPRMVMLHVSDTPLPEVNYHLPLGRGTIDFDEIGDTLILSRFEGPAILEIGGLPNKGGVGHDTDEALVDSARRLRKVLDGTPLTES